MRSGQACPVCLEGRPDEIDGGRLRVYAGRVLDAYLSRDDAARCYVVAFYRGHHVVEPTELAAEESVAFWQELLVVADAIERYFQPMKLNLLLLGNAVPHLHAHVVPRYRDDPDGGEPPRFMMGSSDWQPVADEAYLADVAALRAAYRGGSAATSVPVARRSSA